MEKLNLSDNLLLAACQYWIIFTLFYFLSQRYYLLRGCLFQLHGLLSTFKQDCQFHQTQSSLSGSLTSAAITEYAFVTTKLP